MLQIIIVCLWGLVAAVCYVVMSFIEKTSARENVPRKAIPALILPIALLVLLNLIVGRSSALFGAKDYWDN